MGILIDSSVLIRMEREQTWLKGLDPTEELFISVITASELLHGVFRASETKIRQRRSAFVEGILQNIPILEIDLRVARAHAMLWAELAKSGKMIGLHDSWIAATCIAFGHSLTSYNRKEFERVPGLKMLV